MFETAGALVAFASTANAGITIPAGDWTVDIGGNVNAYYTNTQVDTTVNKTGVKTSSADANTIGTGLLPAAFGIGAKTRQNDLDIAFQFSFFTGTSSGNNGVATNTLGSAGNNTLNIRQAFLSFGDASWGTIKLGRDLGVFGSDAILSDMTLLGVGVGGPAGGSSTLGRIGSGYIYADWKGQVQYASPNFNGFQVTGAVVENFRPASTTTTGVADSFNKSNLGYEAKATYDFAANDVTGRVWVSGITQKTEGTANYTSRGFDIGAKASYAGATLVGYYYDGEGLDGQSVIGGLFNASGNKTKDSGGYVQATFAVPGIGTKLGASWGVSNSKASDSSFDYENESWIVGAYHPLTKSLNLVAEYTSQEKKNNVTSGSKVESDTVSLGAILFF